MPPQTYVGWRAAGMCSKISPPVQGRGRLTPSSGSPTIGRHSPATPRDAIGG
jgi:hypothetical protein